MQIEIDPACVELEILEDFGQIVSYRTVYRGYRFGRFFALPGDGDPVRSQYAALVIVACRLIECEVAVISAHGAERPRL
ncbi:hypothetical protein GI582_05360 [Sulfitobacter sp. BDSS02]|uniref:hypothetical protein n=1 Tax=Heliomarina sp. TaxID=2917556 RepID=UPI00405923FB|nr:hypothetical protein [Sulfitobacter sp. BDSS02]